MPSLTINLNNNRATISGNPLCAVMQALTSTTRSFDVNGGNVDMFSTETHEYFERRTDGGIEAFIGLVPRVRRFLASRGLTARVEGFLAIPSPQQVDCALMDHQGFPMAIRMLSAALAANCYGQITYHHPADQRQILATIVRTFPAQRILLVGRTRHELRGLAGFLTRRTGIQVYSSRDAAFAHANSKLVATTFQYEAVNNDDWHIVVFLSPSAVSGPIARRTARRISAHCHLYCLRSANISLSHDEQLRLESICGPVIFTAKGPSGREAEVDVLLVPAPITKLGTFTTALEGKRNLIWHNRRRNQAVAHLATAFVAGNISALWEHGVLLQEEEKWCDSYFHTPTPTVTVLVQNREHATELHSLLPDWNILTNASHAPTTLHKVIVTELAATKWEIHSQVLITATGSAVAWESILFPKAVYKEKMERQLLVDLVEEVSPPPSAYSARNWNQLK